MIITRRGVEVGKDRLPDHGAAVRRELTVAPLSLNDPFPKKFRTYLESPTKFVVPLHWALSKYPDARLEDRRGEGQAIDIGEFVGSLRPELRQPEAVEAVLKTWDDNRGGATLCLPVGFGKTTTALYLVSRVKKKTLVMVHKGFLKDQWIERIRAHLPGARVTSIQGDECDTTGDIVVAMIQTLLSRQYPLETFKPFGLVVADECHHIGASVFSQCMWSACAPKTLGLSATPDRKDGLSRVVTWFAGPIAFRIRRENQGTTTVEVLKYMCPAYSDPPPTNRRGDICFTSVVSRLVEDEQRTRAIAGKVAAILAADSAAHVLVLSHRRAHCVGLCQAVRALGVESVATYMGGDREVPQARVLIATYALTSEGFDVPALNTLVLATPASDVEQSCGRVMRGTSSTASLIVDVLDQWGVCFAQHAKRRAFYNKSGFTVTGQALPPQQQPPQQALQEFAFLDM